MPVNLPATFLLGAVLMYWLLVILGVLGVDVLDFDSGIDGVAESKTALLGAFKAFLQVGEIPIALMVSLFALLFWFTTVCANHYLNPEYAWWVMMLITVPAIVGSLLLTRLLLMPLRPLFRKDEASLETRWTLIGRQASVNTLELNDQFGEIRIENDGPPLILNARSATGQRLKQGEVVAIVGYDKVGDYYLVELRKPEKN
ncbi:MAG TPA: DUF1449 family protein [Pirellulaceae bacterium]|nr:DUF1449 family protein [Pirellulaceae bacterium]HMO91240.1 DUF1449 family protein [Pirellulaceae bacterium]HMP68576.1 DUF1449 family protein [Pirellulaceae bacterium]